jgi:hypothetical protein
MMNTTPRIAAHTSETRLANVNRLGRNMTSCSIVFWCTRWYRSKISLPVVAGAFTPYFPRA